MWMPGKNSSLLEDWGFSGLSGASGRCGISGNDRPMSGRSVMVSVYVQVNGGRLCRMAVRISITTDSSRKRGQLMLTSQVP